MGLRLNTNGSKIVHTSLRVKLCIWKSLNLNKIEDISGEWRCFVNMYAN